MRLLCEVFGVLSKVNDARAVIAVIVLISVFVELPIFAFLAFHYLPTETALEFIRWTWMLLMPQLGYILGYYFGARNNEKSREIEQKTRSVSIA